MSDAPDRLYGLPHAEVMYDDPATVWELELEPFVDGPGRSFVEEWTVHEPDHHLPPADRLLEWVEEWTLEMGEVSENWRMPSDHPDVQAAVESLYDAIAAAVDYRMAKDMVRRHVVAWDGKGAVTLDGVPMYVPAECPTCRGGGRFLYSSTAMGGGVGGQMMTWGPCPGTRRTPETSDCPVVLAGRDLPRCPDGGRCHHRCKPGRCHRQLGGYAALGEGGEWPEGGL